MFWSREGGDEETRVLKIPVRAEVYRPDLPIPSPPRHFGAVYPSNPHFSDGRWRIVNICRTPCYAKNSRSFVSNRGLSDPNPGPYGAPFRKNCESEPVAWPDWGWSGTGKKGFRGSGFQGGLRCEWWESCCPDFSYGSGNFSEKKFGKIFRIIFHCGKNF